MSYPFFKLSTDKFTETNESRFKRKRRGKKSPAAATGDTVASDGDGSVSRKPARSSVQEKARFQFLCSPVGSETVMVDQIPFPPEITVNKPLTLVGYGITDIEIHFLQIKYTAIGVYMEKEIIDHLGAWKGKKGSDLVEDDLFFDALVSAPVEKYFRVVVIKEIKGSQYGVQLESAVRDRLAAADKYEEEEEEALEKATEFFQTKYFKKDSVIAFHFPRPADDPKSPAAEIGFTTEGKEEVKLKKLKVGNPNVAEMIQKWYLGGSRSVSPTTVKCLADNLVELLGQ